MPSHVRLRRETVGGVRGWGWCHQPIKSLGGVPCQWSKKHSSGCPLLTSRTLMQRPETRIIDYFTHSGTFWRFSGKHWRKVTLCWNSGVFLLQIREWNPCADPSAPGPCTSGPWPHFAVFLGLWVWEKLWLLIFSLSTPLVSYRPSRLLCFHPLPLSFSFSPQRSSLILNLTQFTPFTNPLTRCYIFVLASGFDSVLATVYTPHFLVPCRPSLPGGCVQPYMVSEHHGLLAVTA